MFVKWLYGDTVAVCELSANRNGVNTGIYQNSPSDAGQGPAVDGLSRKRPGGAVSQPALTLRTFTSPGLEPVAIDAAVAGVIKCSSETPILGDEGDMPGGDDPAHRERRAGCERRRYTLHRRHP